MDGNRAVALSDDADRPSNPLWRIPPHVVLHDLLSSDTLAAIQQWSLTHQSLFQPSLIGKGQLRSDYRNSLSIDTDLHPEWLEPLRQHVIDRLPELCVALGIPLFPLDRLVATIIAYRDGAFYRRHIDTAVARGRKPSDRVLSAVYYFHREPAGFTGGELRLFPIDPPPSGLPPHLDIRPHGNSLVAFPSWAPHEVLPVTCRGDSFEDARFAINFWARARRDAA